MGNDLISRSVAIEEFYKRISGDLTIDDVKYIEKVLNEVHAAVHVDKLIDKFSEIITKYREIGTPDEFQEAINIACFYGNNRWIPCGKEMPKNEQEVEITYTWKHPDGRSFYETARAFHTDGTVTTEESGYNWEDTDDWEYCEEKDDVYIPEGWWECVAFCETFSSVDQKVIAWRPCPKPYRPEEKAVGRDYKRQIMDRFLKFE